MDVRSISRLSLAAFVAAVLGGCTTSYQELGTYYVAPGKYEYYRCRDLGVEIAQWTDRERDLSEVMQRNGAETSGTFINAVVYSPELGIARESLRAAREEAQRKNCSPQSLVVKRNANGSIITSADQVPAGKATTTGSAPGTPQQLPPPPDRTR